MNRTTQEKRLDMNQETATRMSAIKQIVGLIISISACFAAAGIGSMATTPNIPTWYAELSKPTWTPPNWLFAPVWTALFLAMAVAAWLVWRQQASGTVRGALILFAVQLLLNTLWSVLFFGLQRPGWAAVEIAVLWIAILFTLIAFWQRSRWAGLLFVPYLLWVSFAGVLNVAVWHLNR
jgi:benzodiazapine receptor